MIRRALPLILIASCTSVPMVRQWGYDCMSAADPQVRQRLVTKIMDTGNPESIPVLIDCLEEAKRQKKLPHRDYDTGIINPDSAPVELWGLYVLTTQDFDFDIRKWREWWVKHRGKLEWDSGRRRFRVKE